MDHLSYEGDPFAIDDDPFAVDEGPPAVGDAPSAADGDPLCDEDETFYDEGPEVEYGEPDGDAAADRITFDGADEDPLCPECGEIILMQYDTQGEGPYWRCDHCGLNLCDDLVTEAFPDTCIPMHVVEKALREDAPPQPKPKRRRRKGQRGGS